MTTDKKTEIVVDLEARPGPKFVHRDLGHVPFNKRRYDIKRSTAELTIVDCPTGPSDGEPWMEINLCETTQTTEGGPFQSRTISTHLHGEDRVALLKMIAPKPIFDIETFREVSRTARELEDAIMAETTKAGVAIERLAAGNIASVVRGVAEGERAALTEIVREMIFGEGTDASLQRVIDLCNEARDAFGIERPAA